MLLDGHIGDCGIAARLHADNTGAVDVSTLREPYRIEGKKTLGLELAEQLGWTLPDAIVYPTGGGTGLIGMWKAFQELRQSGWLRGPLPRMYTVQASGCAPVVHAFESGAERCTPWPDPKTVAAGLRVPSPLGDRLMLRALRESGGGAVAVSDEALAAPRTSCRSLKDRRIAGRRSGLVRRRRAQETEAVLHPEQRIVLFNTGAGWLYRAKPFIFLYFAHAHRYSGSSCRHQRRYDARRSPFPRPAGRVARGATRTAGGRDVRVTVRGRRRAGITCKLVEFAILRSRMDATSVSCCGWWKRRRYPPG